jgi:high-affinity iron transporter
MSCHGETGAGDGPAANGLTPPPGKLDDRSRLAGASPLDFYRRITIGVAGTAMPAFESTLSTDDRWAAALYASVLRLPSAGPAVAEGDRWADFAVTARMSDAVLRDSLGGDLARVAAARRATRSRDYRPIFAIVRRRLDSSFRLADQGKAELARTAALDAYMAFEGVERDLRVKDDALVQRLEAAFAAARLKADRPAELSAIESELTLALERAERAVGTSLGPPALFLQSFVLLIREGLEAILVVGALLTFLARVGAEGRRREIHLGVAAAVLLSLVTAVAIETVFRLSRAHQEALEAGTMVVATGMLFFVSYWLLSKMEVAKWNRFVKTRMADALSERSTLALASVAFLAVYREGFETVLFYKALALSGGEHVAAPIAAGVAAGALALGLIYFGLTRFGIRLPLRPFFAVTSLFLYFMAFTFAGTAIAELQEGGFAPMTPVHWMPRIPLLGMYPTLEGVLLQGLLVALGLLALIWTFVVAPRRREATT